MRLMVTTQLYLSCQSQKKTWENYWKERPEYRGHSYNHDGDLRENTKANRRRALGIAMFIFLDTETTGTGPDDRLCQIAFKPEVARLSIKCSILVCPFPSMRWPSTTSPKKWSRTSRLSKGARHTSDSASWSAMNINIIVAHNAQFDMEMLNRKGFTHRR